MDDMRYLKVKINEVERIVDINPTKRGEAPLMFSEVDGDWIPHQGYFDLRGASFLTHDELGNLSRALRENSEIRQKEFAEKEKAKPKDWRGAVEIRE